MAEYKVFLYETVRHDRFCVSCLGEFFGFSTWSCEPQHVQAGGGKKPQRRPQHTLDATLENPISLAAW
jgi:hypothetical protein